MNKAPSKSFCLNVKRGFTLIEILVASAVMVILVGIVIKITADSLSVWNRSSGRLAANQEARIALDLLTQDLETAVFRNNGLQWLRVENANVGGRSPNTVSIRLFSPALDRPREGEPGDICAISYSLEFVNPVDGTDSGDQSFVLYRRLTPPAETFELMEPSRQEQLSGDGAWDDASGNSGEFYLSGNIVEFRVDLYIEGRNEPINNELDGFVFYGGSGATVGPQVAAEPFRRPLSHADIRLRVLSSEGANILIGLQDQDIPVSGQALDSVLREHATTYTRRVSFMNRPL